LDARGNDTCGQLAPGATYRDLNSILECLERKIEGSKSAAPAEGQNKCWSTDEGNAKLRACVTTVNHGPQNTTIQVEITNKSRGKLVLAADSANVRCGSILSDSAGTRYTDRTGYPPTCNLALLGPTPDPKSLRENLLLHGVPLNPGEYTSATYVHSHYGGTPPESWSLTTSYYITDITQSAEKTGEVWAISFSFPRIRRPK
jgi:hypothetical protein